GCRASCALAGSLHGMTGGRVPMTKLYVDTDKYGYQSDFPIVEAYNAAVKDLVRRSLADSGRPWQEFVFGTEYDYLIKEAMQAIEDRLLAYGYRFEPSAMSSS